jgi:hypothetical protein
VTDSIIMTAESVRAILAGKKTKTRRIIKTREPVTFLGGKGEEDDPDLWGWSFDGPDHHGYMVLGRGLCNPVNHGSCSIPCPFEPVGAQLYVKEAFTHITGNGIRVHYRADGEPVDSEGRALPTEPGLRRWMSPLFMPRKWSRITLEVTQVRVERLQDISEEDAIAEGVVDGMIPATGDHPALIGYVYGKDDGKCALYPTARKAYAVEWDTVNKARRGSADPLLWADNPWVWALSFRRVP